jgi:hypothetical protein
MRAYKKILAALQRLESEVVWINSQILENFKLLEKENAEDIRILKDEYQAKISDLEKKLEIAGGV